MVLLLLHIIIMHKPLPFIIHRQTICHSNISMRLCVRMSFALNSYLRWVSVCVCVCVVCVYVNYAGSWSLVLASTLRRKFGIYTHLHFYVLIGHRPIEIAYNAIANVTHDMPHRCLSFEAKLANMHEASNRVQCESNRSMCFSHFILISAF